MRRRLLLILALVAIVSLLTILFKPSLFTQLPAQTLDPALAKLREDVAMHYLEPAPHVALAKYHHDRGNRLLAFYILEYARREMFEKDEFDQEFGRVFLNQTVEPFDNSKQAEAALLKREAAEPTSAVVAMKLADVYISRDDWPRAERHLRKAIDLDPRGYSSVAALMEVLERAGKPAEAEKVASEFIAKNPRAKEAYVLRFGRLFESKDWNGAKRLTEEALREYPDDPDLIFNLGTVLQEEGKLQEAEDHYVRAATSGRVSAHLQGWTGRFFLKVREDHSKALEYYLSAYFLDPHFYDTEYAEFRIQKLGKEAADKEFAQLAESSKGLERALRSDNPLVVLLAIDRIRGNWDAKYTPPLIEAMSHDDEFVRGNASSAIADHVDNSFDEQLRAMLKDTDLRKRGLAGHMAMKLWGDKALDRMIPWLAEDAQLVRYDAFSALVDQGGTRGREIARDHLARESNPRLRRWVKGLLESPDKKKSQD